MLFDLYNLKIRGQASVAIGASTSICAIMGLYIAQVIILYQKKEDIKQAKRSVISMLISLVVISLMPGVDLLGHFGSLFSGLFLGMMLLPGSDVEVSKVKKIGIGSFIGYTMILLTMFI
jgi:membrane associated rhomboid family serine protease